MRASSVCSLLFPCLIVMAVMTASACKPRLSTARLQSAPGGAAGALSDADLGRLVQTAGGEWANPETQIAWLTLGSSFLGHIDNVRTNLEILNRANSSTLNLKSGVGDPGLSLDQQRILLDTAKAEADAALNQQKLMVEAAKSNSEFAARNSEFFGKMDQQRFDQRMKEATTAVEVEGKQIDNFIKRIEAEKKIIENEILRDYASAYNSYVRAFHEYTLAMSAAMRGASKVNKQAGVLANSVLEYDRRVRKCSAFAQRLQFDELLSAVKQAKIADYSRAQINGERDLIERVTAIEDLPNGAACLEMGLIQANAETVKERSPVLYANASPILKLTPNPNPAADSPSVIVCPAVAPKPDPLKLAVHVQQVDEFAGQIATGALALASVNESLASVPVNVSEPSGPSDVEAVAGADTSAPADQPAETPPAANLLDAEDERTVGELFDANEAIDFASALESQVSRSDGKVSLVPFPVTAHQAVRLIQNGNLQFRVSTSPKAPYCSLNPANDQAGKTRLSRYVQAVRDYEAARLTQLKRDLAVAGVRFRADGKLQADPNEPFKPGSWNNDAWGNANRILRRGFFYAQQCTSMATKQLVKAGQLPGATALTLPPPTEFLVGESKYSFFFPQYTLGDDTNTSTNEVTQATRHCVDNALSTLAQSQQALKAAGEYSKYFEQAANIKAPAAPIPYIPNAAPGTVVYSR